MSDQNEPKLSEDSTAIPPDVVSDARKIAEAIANEPKKLWLSGQTKPFRANLIRVRRLSTVCAMGAVAGSLASCLLPVIPWIAGAAGLAGVATSMALQASIQAELLGGAGEESHNQYAKGTKTWREYSFKSSLGRPATLLALLGLGVVANVLGAAAIYAGIGRLGAGHFSAPVEGASALYFSVVTFATVGYGDLVPSSALARAAVVAHIGVSFVSVVVILATATSWLVTQARAQHEEVLRAREADMREAEAAFAKAGVGFYSEKGKRELEDLATSMKSDVPPPKAK